MKSGRLFGIGIVAVALLLGTVSAQEYHRDSIGNLSRCVYQGRLGAPLSDGGWLWIVGCETERGELHSDIFYVSKGRRSFQLFEDKTVNDILKRARNKSNPFQVRTGIWEQAGK
jgi:hypothetical protein